MSDLLHLETTNLNLAAAILTAVPRARFSHVIPDRLLDGKKPLVITYPADQAQTVQQVTDAFYGRRLTVALYPFNRTLNALRDRLKQGDAPGLVPEESHAEHVVLRR